MTTTEATARLDEEIAGMDREIEKLEAERAELDAPTRALTWDEIQAGAMEDLEARERRRGLLPRLIVAAKVKRLELQKAKLEGEMGPLRPAREEAHEKLQQAAAKRRKAAEEEDAARYEYSDAHTRIESREGHVKRIDREIRELRGEG